MSSDTTENRIRQLRRQRNWSQQQLATLAGVSRTAISAIEQQRLTPSVTAALAIARALGCTVEELFDQEFSAGSPEWAWQPTSPGRYWTATVSGRVLCYPVESTAAGTLAHDGCWAGRKKLAPDLALAERNLVIATCDPAIGLLATEYARQTPFRLIPILRSSGEGLALLQQQKIHAAGVHLAESRTGNLKTIREVMGPGHLLLRGSVWREGIAFAPHLGFRSTRSARKSGLNWVGRQEGSGAQACLREFLGNRPAPRKRAADHRGVAIAIQGGWADAGVCLQMTAEESGLGFLELRREAYDLCFRSDVEQDPRVKALCEVVRSSTYQKLLDALPGFDSRTAGSLDSC